MCLGVHVCMAIGGGRETYGAFFASATGAVGAAAAAAGLVDAVVEHFLTGGVWYGK